MSHANYMGLFVHERQSPFPDDVFKLGVCRVDSFLIYLVSPLWSFHHPPPPIAADPKRSAPYVCECICLI